MKVRVSTVVAWMFVILLAGIIGFLLFLNTDINRMKVKDEVMTEETTEAVFESEVAVFSNVNVTIQDQRESEYASDAVTYSTAGDPIMPPTMTADWAAAKQLLSDRFGWSEEVTEAFVHDLYIETGVFGISVLEVQSDGSYYLLMTDNSEYRVVVDTVTNRIQSIEKTHNPKYSEGGSTYYAEESISEGFGQGESETAAEDRTGIQ